MRHPPLSAPRAVRTLSIGLALIALLVAPTGAAARGAKPGSSTGYDTSYPQCNGSFPASPAFAIVGVNAGIVYSPNPCLGTGDGPSELAWAGGTAAQLYANTANPGPTLSSWLATDPAQADRDRLGVTLFAFYVGTLYRHGLFHADPHPGNTLVQADGRIVQLDYGCVREFPPERVRALAQLTAAVHRDDAGAIREALLAVGVQNPGKGKDFDHTLRFVRSFYAASNRPGPHAVDLVLNLAGVTDVTYAETVEFA
jgi:hypothetical protein